MEKDEIWKDIFGYENIYQVSNLGRVRGLKRKTGNSTGYYIRKGKILKKAMNIHGYEFVILSKNGKRKTITVHRLVAEAFIPNPNHFPCINHKNENRACNIVENLEWCTHKYNSNYGTSQKRKVMAISKPIIQMDLKECEIQTFSSSREIERIKGYKHQNIIACCRGIHQSAYGYKWKYKI
jgi:prophage lambdaSa2, HNH endonuclease family protein